MLSLIPIVAALALELWSLSAMLLAPGGGEGWLLMGHATASGMLAWFLWYRLPSTVRRSRPWVTGLLFNFAFFVPLLGVPGILIVVFVAGLHRRASAAHAFASVAVPEFLPPRLEANGAAARLAIESRQDSARLPASRRLKSLLALQGIPPRIASPVLHHMLGDTSDDIRLVAYGMLDAREKKVAADIDRELAVLSAAQDAAVRLPCLKRLCELHWELAYAGLAEGDLRARALSHGLMFAEEALALAPDDYGLLFLKGRILQEMNRSDEAFQALQCAMEKGLPESRALPYIAEIQFQRGEYEQVRAALLRVSELQVTPRMNGVIHVWVGDASPRGGNSSKGDNT